MLGYPLATALLIFMQDSASAAAASSPKAPQQTKIDFLRAMNARKNKRRRRLSLKEFQAEIRGDSQKSAELRKKMIAKGTVIKPPGGGERKLQNYNYYNPNNANNANQAEDDNANANNYANGNYGNQEKNYKYNEDHDGTDDYFTAFGEWENTFGFDPTMFSISYHRCAAVRQFDDVIAATEDTDSVFATKNFAVFRMCPEQTCMGWQEQYDCGCEDQCDEIFENMESNGYEVGDNDEEYCEEACESQCEAWQQQYDLNGGGQQYQEEAEVAYQQAETSNNKDVDEVQGQGDNRKLQNYYNNYNANKNANGNAQYYNYNQNQFSQMTFDPYYLENQEEKEIWGARGEGCQANYGEYLIEMKDYLSLMLEWQEERFETYCEYCEDCMYKVYQQWLKNGGQRDLKYEDFKETNKHRELGNYYGACPEYDTCVEYAKMCNGGVQDEFSDYFECTEVERNNGQVAYIGPHCAEDGFELTLGLYADENCYEYIGNGVAIANFLGEELEEDALRSYYNSVYGATLEQLKFVNEDDVCIPCRKGDLMWEEEGNNADDDNINYDSDEINELCENLYYASARCDKHFRSYNNKSKQAKYAEAVAQEDLSCDFIDSIVMGNYNEMGWVDFGDTSNMEKKEWGWANDNIYVHQAGEYMSKVSPWQIFGLIASLLAVILLGAWSVRLSKSLVKTGPWKPRRGLQRVASPQVPDLSRMDSGIVMGRSNSSTDYYMS